MRRVKKKKRIADANVERSRYSRRLQGTRRRNRLRKRLRNPDTVLSPLDEAAAAAAQPLLLFHSTSTSLSHLHTHRQSSTGRIWHLTFLESEAATLLSPAQTFYTYLQLQRERERWKRAEGKKHSSRYLKKDSLRLRCCCFLFLFLSLSRAWELRTHRALF